MAIELVVGASKELPGVAPPTPVPAGNPSPVPAHHPPALLLGALLDQTARPFHPRKMARCGST